MISNKARQVTLLPDSGDIDIMSVLGIVLFFLIRQRTHEEEKHIRQSVSIDNLRA
jgi:hypothetical protein